MFNFLEKRKFKYLQAPIDGKAINVTEIDDPVFKDKILGDGIVIIPSSDEAFSPCDGTIVQVAHTLHAICIKSTDGLEILLHFGIDTVKLEGKGFKCEVKENDEVKKGDKLLTFDRKLIEESGFKTITPCIITNMDAVKEFEPISGEEVIHNETNIIKYKI